MATLREWLHRLWGALRRNRVDSDLEEELRLHLELTAEDMRHRSGAVEDSERTARLHAGGISQAMDALREQRGVPWLEALARDLRRAVRSLCRTPAFTLVALLTLALGIGANTAIFSIVNGVVLSPLDYPKPEQLMYLDTQIPELGLLQHPVSLPEYFEYREFNKSFAEVGAYMMGEVNLAASDRPLRVRVATVDSNLLRALAIVPEQGRLFATGETDVTGPWHPGDPANMQPSAIAILSHELWQSAFGGQPMLGKTVEVDGRRSKVIGIMPPGADLMDNRTQIWLPLGLNPSMREYRGWHVLHLVGRLKDGVTPAKAQTELNGLIENWGERVGVDRRAGGFIPLGQPGAHVLQMRPMQDVILGGANRSIWVLQAAVGLVLLIACANLANLLLARAETRRREFALHIALGAGRVRLLSQFMAEAVLLSIAGGILGLFLAWTGVQALIRAYPTSLPRMAEVTVDLPILLFTLGVSVATSLVFGFAPFLHVRMKALATSLTEGGGRITGGVVRQRIRGSLVVAEVGLAVMLVIGAGLLLRTVYNLTSVDVGFDRARLVTFSMTTPYLQYTHGARGQLYQQILVALRSVPGVESATATAGLPPVREPDGEGTYIDNYVGPTGQRGANVDHYQSVMSDYFETMGIPIVQGRSFQPADATSSGMVAIVNETFVKRFWNGLNPIGQRLRPGWAKPWFTVVGVAKDVKQSGLDHETGTEFYFFVDQMALAPNPLGRTPAAISVVLRTTLRPAALSKTIDRIVREADAAVPVAGLRDMDAVFAESIRRPRLLAELVGGFASVALLLAAIGTYGVLSYMVAGRRREIGIRIALGARRSVVLSGIMHQGLRLALGGIVIGVVGALALNRFIGSLLFGVQPTDAPTLAISIIVITFVAVVACSLPAWRASKLDPNVVLRE